MVVAAIHQFRAYDAAAHVEVELKIVGLAQMTEGVADGCGDFIR